MKQDAFPAGLYDFREVSRVGIGDFITLAGFGAKDAREMARILAMEFGGAGVDRIDEKSSAGQTLLYWDGETL